MLGSLGRADTGCKKMELAGAGRTERKDSDLEPVNFHANTDKFWKEIIHQFEPASIVELTVLDPTVAYECIKAGVSYVGCAFTKHHSQVLQKLLNDTFKTDV